MIEVDVTLKEWGKSIGVVLPKKALEHEKLKAGEKVTLLVLRKSNTLKKTFGIAKFKRNTDEILHEVDKEGWDE